MSGSAYGRIGHAKHEAARYHRESLDCVFFYLAFMDAWAKRICPRPTGLSHTRSQKLGAMDVNH